MSMDLSEAHAPMGQFLEQPKRHLLIDDIVLSQQDSVASLGSLSAQRMAGDHRLALQMPGVCGIGQDQDQTFRQIALRDGFQQIGGKTDVGEQLAVAALTGGCEQD